MAGCDYRSCDVCGAKTFYDANLNYVKDEKTGEYTLHGIGDWKVICETCAKEWETVLRKKDAPALDAQIKSVTTAEKFVELSREEIVSRTELLK